MQSATTAPAPSCADDDLTAEEGAYRSSFAATPIELAGRIVDETGHSLSGVEIQLETSGTITAATTTERDGSFLFTGLLSDRHPAELSRGELGIPFCKYSRQADSSSQEFARFKGLRQWDSEEITLAGIEEMEFADQIVALFRGFEPVRFPGGI